MTYQQAIEFLYSQHPAYERHGAGAYKPGLETSRCLAAAFGNPQNAYPIIHVAGTNGKGSVSHMLAAVLQSAGYKVGLFTSPHLVDFRERIKVDGQMISRADVVSWVMRYRRLAPAVEPSFFELTSTMALNYFAKQAVDIAIVEVGLGGRLDSTNIVSPIVSVVTNIALDHTDLLGNTLPQIAREKAGIIKPHVLVVVGEVANEAVRAVFLDAAMRMDAPLTFACDAPQIIAHEREKGVMKLRTGAGQVLQCDLIGDYQPQNVNTVLAVVDVLKTLGWRTNVASGLAHVAELTGLMGRWMVLRQEPMVVCDAAHNPAGMRWAMSQLASTPHDRLHMVVGFMADKDVKSLLQLLPRDATYVFTQAATPRALPACQLAQLAAEHGLEGVAVADVKSAVRQAMRDASRGDVVYVGGSMYVLAELFAAWPLEDQ